MSGTDGIQIAREGLGHALSDNYLAVPIYQRSYAWDETNVTDFLHDIGEAIAAGEGEYFLGSIVVACQTEKKPEVVDGQQRLATATILLAAVRDYFHANNDQKRADGIEHTYLMTTDLRTQEILPRLRLNESDNDYFKNRILLKPDDPVRVGLQKTKPTRESHKRINEAGKIAVKHVNDVVAPFKEATRGDRLIDWIEYVRERARVIWVMVPDHANAFVIFETLNDRGLELSTADLLKNYLFGRSSDRIKEAQQRWSSMIGALETVTSDDITKMYIKHLWASAYGPVREKQLYANIKGTVKTKQAAIDLATNLADNAPTYAAILNPAHELWNPYGTTTRRHIDTLKTLRAEQLRPLLLAAAKVLPVAEAKKAIRLFVCWAVRFLIAGGHGGGVMEKAYAERAIDIRKGKIKNTVELAAAMREFVPSDPIFQEAFSGARASQINLARYYLRALETQKRNDPQPELVPNMEEEQVDLEHILPESLDGAWPQFTPELAEAYYRRIGNMVLLKASANSSLGSAAFDEKKKVYANSHFELTKSVAQFNTWTTSEIDQRQKQLAELAVKTWPITVS